MTRNKEIKSSHLGLKLVSLVLALLLEVYFYSPDNSVTAVIPVTVKVFGLPSEVMIVKPLGAGEGIRAEMEVRGPGPLVAQLQNGPNLLPLVAPEGAPREFRSVLEPLKLQLPSGVEVLGIDPDAVEIATEKIVRKKLIVVGQKVGKPAPGFLVEDVSFAPDTVLVSGPASRMKGLSAVETKEFDISELEAPTRLDLGLRSYGPLVKFDETTVRVNIKVAPVQGEKLLRDVRVKVLAPPGFTALAKSSKAELRLKGSINELAKLEKALPELTADARALGEGEHSIELTTLLPDGVELKSITPPTVRVIVKGSDG